MTTLLRRGLLLMKREAPAEGEQPSRVRRFVLSDESVDSYNSVIKADGWELERFEKNPVVLFGHNSWSHPIGKGKAFVEGTQLMLDVTFLPEDVNPIAERTLRIIDEGLMGASVGFDPLEWEIDEDRATGDEDWWNAPIKYTRQSLLEASIVTIPANPNCLPEGREHIRSLIGERLSARRGKQSAGVPAPLMSPDQFRSMVERITREEKQAQAARRSGKTSRS